MNSVFLNLVTNLIKNTMIMSCTYMVILWMKQIRMF